MTWRVISARHYLVAPDVKVETLDFAQRVLLPLIGGVVQV
jgi:hypothetical protein